eukprot:IDg17656t1
MLLWRPTEKQAPELEDAQAALREVRNTSPRVEQRKMQAAADAHKKRQVPLPPDVILAPVMYKRRTRRGRKQGPQATEDTADTRKSHSRGTEGTRKDHRLYHILNTMTMQEPTSAPPGTGIHTATPTTKRDRITSLSPTRPRVPQQDLRDSRERGIACVLQSHNDRPPLPLQHSSSDRKPYQGIFSAFSSEKDT